MDSATFARSLEKGLDGRGVTGELNPGISPVHVVTQESEHPEYRYLRLERFGIGASVDGADAANFSNAGISNPAGSGALIIVESILILNTTGVGQSYRVNVGANVTFDAAVKGFIADLRYGPTATVRATADLFIDTTAAAQGALVGRVALPGTSTLVFPGPFILQPGFFVAVSGVAINTEASVTVRWIERAAESGELQGSGV